MLNRSTENPRGKRRPTAAAITLSSPVLTFTAFNTATVVCTLSSGPGNGTFTPSGITMHAAGRSWDFTSASATVAGTTLTITGIAGTVVDTTYSSAQDLLTYNGSDTTHLPNVQSATNVAVTFTGGALVTATANAAINVTSQLMTQAMTGSLGAFCTATDSYFQAWLSNVKYSFIGFVSVDGTTLLITACGSGSGESHANECRYDGKNTAIVDASGRPVMPFTTTVAAQAAGAYPTHSITTQSTAYTSTGPGAWEYSGFKWDAANSRLWAIDDGGELIIYDSSYSQGSHWSLGGDKEDLALVESQSGSVFILNEGPNGVLGSIDEYTTSGSFVRNYSFASAGTPVGVGGNGDEGLAYVNHDANFAGDFVVGHQSTGDLYFMTANFTTHAVAAHGSPVVLSLGSDDAASVEVLNDGTILVFYDNIDTIYRIRMTSDFLSGITIDTNDARIVEKWVHENVGGDAEAICIRSARSGSGVRETHSMLIGDDRGESTALIRDYGNVPMAIFPLSA